VKFLLLVSLFIGNVFAKSELYQLQGNVGVSKNSRPIKFTLNWKENKGIAEGSYTDNFYSIKPTILRGIAGKNGRIFIATLPDIINGVKTISFLSSDLKIMTGTKKIPVSVVMRDDKGNPITTSAIDGDLSSQTSRVAQRQEAKGCSEGFGALAGYCGEYRGLMTEAGDLNKRCTLTDYSNFRLVIDGYAEVGLVLGESNALINPPVHVIGRLMANTSSSRVDLLSRQCRPLVGTTFPGDNCKRLNLVGTFSGSETTKHFAGSYTISDEKLNQFCTYSLSVDLEE